MLRRACFGAVLFLLSVQLLHAADPAPSSIAIYYGADPPLDELRAFDVAVVDPDHPTDPAAYNARNSGRSELFAYVSVGEADPKRAYAARIPPAWLAARNADWGTRVIDQTAPGWPAFFLDQVIAPLWARGYRGFFLDTLDAYTLIGAKQAEQQAALIALVRAWRTRFPGAKLLFNRGFELLPALKDEVYAVAAESLYRGFKVGSNAYAAVPEADRAWLGNQLREAKQITGRPVLAIDYVAPGDRALARATAQRIAADGFIPWVTDGALDQLGIGAVEVLPRKVLVLHDNPQDLDPHYLPAQRFLAMPLNYLGYSVELIDISKPGHLPQAPLAGRYAGIVTWFSGTDTLRDPAYAPWLAEQVKAGLKLVMFSGPGTPWDGALAQTLGLEPDLDARPRRLSLVAKHPLAGFESPVIPRPADLYPVRMAPGVAGEAVVKLRDEAGKTYDAAALMPWGGYALAPYVIATLDSVDLQTWVIQPIEFLRRALDAHLPAPDVTTENGLRLLMVHVDGDGFASRAEIAAPVGAKTALPPFAAEVLHQQFVRRLGLPMTVSVIEGEVGPTGLYPKLSPELETIARGIFAEPNVEIASHSFSHPFIWSRAVANADDAGSEGFTMNLPGYEFDLKREIEGSRDYIDQHLAPPGKHTTVFLWTGNCVPPAEAIAQTTRAGLLNMNGGDTRIMRDQPTLTAVAPLGLRKHGQLQVFAPNQNENIYTNNWNGPFYGFERVLETFEMTERPYRLKPIDIYFHTYSASKPGSIAALRKVFDTVLTQPVLPVYASDYLRKVLDFEGMVFYRRLDEGGLGPVDATSNAASAAVAPLHVRGDGALRTLRVRDGLGTGVGSMGVLGASAAADGAGAFNGEYGGKSGGEYGAEYLALAGGEASLLPRGARQAGTAKPDPTPMLIRATGRIASVQREPGSLRFALAVPPGRIAPAIEFTSTAATDGSCTMTIDDQPAALMRSGIGGSVYSHRFIGHGLAKNIAIRCRG